MKNLNKETPQEATAATPADSTPHQPIGDWVIAKNNQFIAFNKPAGIPVQADKTGDKPLLQLAEIYTKSKLFLVHRLDRPASGVVVFAKTKTMVGSLGDQFKERSVHKTYLAVVKDLPKEQEGTLRHFLQKDGKSNRSGVSDDEALGDLSELKYRVLASSDNYHLLEVQLITGRHHQIRAQLAAIGCPIKGDVKYGARRGNRDRSIHLHAWKLGFRHPVSGEQVALVAALPDDPVWNAFSEAIAKPNDDVQH
ncbi:MAG: RNA pseudouridine synthase [Saprospiraceae bacterium]|nr:RNA pseudouridine synthase [Saprospiraceae bacterium]